MRNTYIDDWQQVKERFNRWWNRETVNKPLMRITAPGRPGKPAPAEKPRDPKDYYCDVSFVINEYRNYCETHYFLADAFPAIRRITFGAGTMAVYLGSEPGFSWETVWFTPIFSGPEEFGRIRYDENNSWWLLHQRMMKEAVELARGDFFIPILDIVENVDILSALRGPQELCFDMIDEPELVSAGVKKIDDLYSTYFDRCYDILHDEDQYSAYQGAFIAGKGKTGKLQCDYSALISQEMFREFVQPSLLKQCRKLDHSLYHLDGPDAVKHVPALMELEELDALQWIPGAGKPDSFSEDWYPIYDQVIGAGKALQLFLYDGGPEDWANGVRKLVKRYGATGLYFIFPDFPDLASAQKMASLFD